MTQHVRYALLVLRHKYFVFKAGVRLKVPWWRLILHDWHKFTPVEFFAYSDKFIGKKDNDAALAAAWLHHQNIARHHWEYWVTRSVHKRSAIDYEDALPMPEMFVREMIADWIGAQHTYKNSLDVAAYLKKNLPGMKLHPLTRTRLDHVLAEVGIYLS